MVRRWYAPKAIDPGRFAHFNDLLQELYFQPAHTRDEVRRQLVSRFRLMPPPKTDTTGFRIFCERAHLAWLKVRLVRERAA
mmetsp:Transcript_79596/g.184772  ORF Transcript_79596/g.184772 Transcript_79596/m.184772 type:complete len:81 (+) Transcript_79596:795-1037(+)